MKTPSSPEEYREQAERARRLADVVTSEEMRQRLLEVSRGYQDMAASNEAGAQRRVRSRADAPRPTAPSFLT